VHQGPDGQRLGRLHQVQQLILVALGQLGQQVGRVVGIHLLQHVGGPVPVERGQDLYLITFGQLAEDVGQPLVV
jgi:hypothetical protein